MATRRYEKPFGTELRNDGSARFALWAPSSSSVDLCLLAGVNDDAVPHSFVPMVPDDMGWFHVTTTASVDTHYLFRIDGEHLTWCPIPHHAINRETCIVRVP
jgi:maltooligosyltrehalose trehalohydrolase